MGDRKTFIMLMGFVLLTLLVVGCSQATLPEETSVPRETLLPSETATISQRIHPIIIHQQPLDRQ